MKIQILMKKKFKKAIVNKFIKVFWLIKIIIIINYIIFKLYIYLNKKFYSKFPEIKFLDSNSQLKII